MIMTTLATVAMAIAPTVEFTSDSTYRKENILDFSVSEKTVHDLDDDTGEQISEERFYTLNVNCNYVLGYDVYDNPDTPYIDGIKIDGAFLQNTWKVDDFDPDAKHSVLVRTVYSDDISGWLAQAKDGDFSALMANPVTLLQFGYYIIAGVSLVLGGFGLLKSKKRKIKTADDIAGAVSSKADDFLELATNQSNDMETKALSLVTDIVTPLVNTLSKQNDILIKATVLARNGDEASTIALLDLLKNTGAEGVADISDAVKKRIQESKAAAEKAKQDAIKDMKEAVAELPAPNRSEGYDGTSI